MSDLWRSLKIGDRVRVVTWPLELQEDRLHVETRELYKWLIDTQSVLTITRIDEWGLPYGELCRIVNGVEQWESVALNHSGLELVESSDERKTGQSSP